MDEKTIVADARGPHRLEHVLCDDDVLIDAATRIFQVVLDVRVRREMKYEVHAAHRLVDAGPIEQVALHDAEPIAGREKLVEAGRVSRRTR